MSVNPILETGLLELYVIGDLSDSEKLLVENAMKQDEAVRLEVIEIEKTMEAYALHNAISAPPAIKPMLFAALNYQSRIENGELPVSSPKLSDQSKVSDFSQWLDREDMQEPSKYDSMFGKIIDSNEKKTTLIVWLKDGAPDETHTDEIEKFLIVEGTCDIQIGDDVHSLKSGDFLSIPLHINHNVKVTSSIRCKLILERSAA